MKNPKLLVLILFSTISLTSTACVCSEFDYMPIVSEKHLDSSAYQLFTAEILSIEEVTQAVYKDTAGLTDYQKSQTRTFQLITLTVIKSYGHQITTGELQIATGMNGGLDCGVTYLKKGKKYLLTVGTKTERSKYFWTSICVPIRLLASAQEEIEFIEQNI